MNAHIEKAGLDDLQIVKALGAGGFGLVKLVKVKGQFRNIRTTLKNGRSPKKIIKVSPIVHLPSSAFKRPVSCNMDNKDISWTKRTFLLQSILNSYLDFIKLTKVRRRNPYLLHFGNIQERHLWKKFKHRS